MALIRINGETENRFGKLSFTRERIKNNETLENEILISGTLSTHEYIEEILSIESERYILNGVDVYHESFGSNDIDIYYSFFANEIIIKDEHVPEDILWAIEENEIEKEINDKQYFHTYAFNEGMENAKTRALKYREEESNNE